MEYLVDEKLTEEMLEKYVKGIYVYDDGWRWSGKHNISRMI